MKIKKTVSLVVYAIIIKQYKRNKLNKHELQRTNQNAKGAAGPR